MSPDSPTYPWPDLPVSTSFVLVSVLVILTNLSQDFLDSHTVQFRHIALLRASEARHPTVGKINECTERTD